MTTLSTIGMANSFRRACLESPEDATNWLVFADWLEDHDQLSLAAAYRMRRLRNSLGMELVLVPAGSFWMGGGGGKPGKKQVTVAQDFYLGIYPVIQQQWQAIMGSNPSHFKGDDLPVEQVSWNDIQEFLKRLNELERNNGWLYRLPTEAEWEYACRGGFPSGEECSFHFYFARPTNDLSSDQANFDGNYPKGRGGKGPYLERTTKVGSYQPNRLGLYDMHGNVWEWTSSEEGSDRVVRGGSWFSVAENCAAASRRRLDPGYRSFSIGVRLLAVRSV